MNELKEAVKAGGKKMTVLGVIAIVLGILAILSPAVAGTSVMLILGVVVLMGGLARTIWALQSGIAGKGVLKFAAGVLTLLCGIALIADPMLGSGVLTVLLAIYFLLDGIVEVVAGFMRKPGSGWSWMLVAGLISILLAVVIWKQFPLSGIWAIGVVLGVKLFFAGVIMLTAGTTVRSMLKT